MLISQLIHKWDSRIQDLSVRASERGWQEKDTDAHTVSFLNDSTISGVSVCKPAVLMTPAETNEE